MTMATPDVSPLVRPEFRVPDGQPFTVGTIDADLSVHEGPFNFRHSEAIALPAKEGQFFTFSHSGLTLSLSLMPATPLPSDGTAALAPGTAGSTPTPAALAPGTAESAGLGTTVVANIEISVDVKFSVHLPLLGHRDLSNYVHTEEIGIPVKGGQFFTFSHSGVTLTLSLAPPTEASPALPTQTSPETLAIVSRPLSAAAESSSAAAAEPTSALLPPPDLPVVVAANPDISTADLANPNIGTSVGE